MKKKISANKLEIALFLAVLSNWKLYCILPSSVILVLFYCLIMSIIVYLLTHTHIHILPTKSLEIFFY